MKLLLVEDDPHLGQVLSQVLRAAHSLDCATTLKQGIYLSQLAPYDLILLDLKLPDGNGLELCRYLRTKHDATPILVLTAEDTVGEKIRVLDAGADDYLCKPFHTAELEARIRALLRRPAGLLPQTLIYEDLEVNLLQRVAKRGNQTLKLRRREFDILVFLMRHPNQVISRGSLIEHLWDESSEIYSNTIDVHIKFIRDQLDKPFKEPFIHTAVGIGYRFGKRIRKEVGI